MEGWETQGVAWLYLERVAFGTQGRRTGRRDGPHTSPSTSWAGPPCQASCSNGGSKRIFTNHRGCTFRFLLSTMSQCGNIVGPRCPGCGGSGKPTHWGAAGEVCTAHHHISTMHCFPVSRRRADMECRVGAGTFVQPRSRASRWHSRSTSGAQVLCNSGASRHPSAT